MAKPEIRLKGFEGEWERYKIGDITSIVTGATPSTAVAEYWNNGTLRWMSSGELNNKHIYDVKGRITQNGYNHSGTHIIPPLCILIGLAGQGKTRGTAAINYVELCTNQSIAALLPNIKLFDSHYLFYYIDNKYLELRNLSTGDGGRGGLNKQILLDFDIKLPSIAEQKAIAEYFEYIDSLIQSTTKKIESLKQMKQACLVSMFPQAGETTPRVRFKGFEGEWLHVELSECLSVCKDRNTSESYNKNDVLSVSDDFGVVNQIELLGRSYAGKSVANYRILRKGDIVYTKSPLKVKPFGIIKVNNGKDGIVSTLYAVYTPMDWVSSEYISYYFEPSFRMNKYIHPLVNKGAKNDMKVSDENVLKGKIYIPKDIAEQEKIASFFTSLDKQISLQEQKLEKLKQIKAACLDKMFV